MTTNTPISVAIDPRVVNRHPDAVVRGFFVVDLAAAAPRLDVPSGDEVRNVLASAGVSSESLVQQPVIEQWRTAIGLCGLKPSKFRSSAEALARRYLGGGVIDTPLPVVNAYCAISAKHLAPLAGYDCGRLPAPSIDLRFGQTTDSFEPLGGGSEDMPITESVVVYAAGSTVLCFAFNHRDSKETCLLPTTDSAVFIGEATTKEQDVQLRTALNDLRGLLESAGASVIQTVNIP